MKITQVLGRVFFSSGDENKIAKWPFCGYFWKDDVRMHHSFLFLCL